MKRTISDLLERFEAKPGLSIPNPFKTKEAAQGIILPKAFLAATLKKCGQIPAGVDVLVEIDFAGNYELTWLNDNDQEVQYTVCKNNGYVDVSSVYEDARSRFLSSLSDEDLAAEIEQRKRLNHSVETGQKNAHRKTGDDDAK